MEYVKLGRTGLEVSRICLGCMSYGVYDRRRDEVSLDEVERIVIFSKNGSLGGERRSPSTGDGGIWDMKKQRADDRDITHRKASPYSPPA